MWAAAGWMKTEKVAFLFLGGWRGGCGGPGRAVSAASKKDGAQPGPTLCTRFTGAMDENPESSSRQVCWNFCPLQLWEVSWKAVGLIGSLFLTLSNLFCCCSVATSCPTLRLHELQHARLLCPSPSPRACSDSCPLSWWCYLSISSSATLFSFRLQSFPASGSCLHIRWPEYWSFSFSISPSNEYSGLISFRIDWFDPLAVHGTLKESSQARQFKSISSLALNLLFFFFFNPSL